MAQNFEPGEAEQVLLTPRPSAAGCSPLDFLRAKAHLLDNEALRRKLTDPRVHMTGYGKDAERKDLPAGRPRAHRALRLRGEGREPRAAARTCGSSSTTTACPRCSGLKTWLPDAFQRVFRLRRSSQRVVS